MLRRLRLTFIIRFSKRKVQLKKKKELSSFRVVISAVAGNALITLAKFIGWLMTSSPSMLAESIHSLADTANQVLLFIGLKQSQTGPSREYPWGRGAARYMWNLISAVGIFFLGFGVTTYHGIKSLFHLDDLSHHSIGLVPIVILIISFFLEGYVFLMALRVVHRIKGTMGFFQYIRKGDDPTAVAVLMEDGVAVLGVLLALIALLLSKIYETSLPDAIISIVIGCLMGVMALILAYSNGRLLIGASAEAITEQQIKEFLESLPSVEKVISIKTEILAPKQLRLTVEVEFHGESLVDRQQIAKDAEKIRSGEEDPVPILVDTAERMVRRVGKEINEIEKKLMQQFPQLKIIELEVN
ncbi:MAG: cation diffusion facilitator family transporter [Bdellovibrio sp.]|nr:MAG: cation diffusion facilitator family transporter [Bdellovibrio sp.]